MNLGQILGYILILSGIILSLTLVTNEETKDSFELSTFFSAYAGVCFTAGTITFYKSLEKPCSKEKLGEIRVFSERD